MAKFYKKSPEVRQIAIRLKDKFPDKFGHIELELVAFMEVSGNSKFAAKVIRVKPPHSLLMAESYIVYVLEKKWETLAAPQRHLVIYHELIHIPDPFGQGSLIDHDIKDFKEILQKYGVDWYHNKELPDILGE